jgi:hypothetical protein
VKVTHKFVFHFMWRHIVKISVSASCYCFSRRFFKYISPLIFCWPCIIMYHNNVNNLIHFTFIITLFCLNPLHVPGVKRPSSGGTTLQFLVWVACTCSCWLVASCRLTHNLQLYKLNILFLNPVFIKQQRTFKSKFKSLWVFRLLWRYVYDCSIDGTACWVVILSYRPVVEVPQKKGMSLIVS